MTKPELLAALQEILNDPNHDAEGKHIQADELLIQYINDPEVTEAYAKIEKWYA